MDVRGDCRSLLDRCDEVRKEKHGRREVAVCDIEMQYVCVASDAIKVGGQIDQVR
jgi:hypothetical protein